MKKMKEKKCGWAIRVFVVMLVCLFYAPQFSFAQVTVGGIGGGNCANIGAWDESVKTCTLNRDINETIVINGGGVVLDGAGHYLTGGGLYGVYTSGGGVTIKNITVSGFSYGIYLYYSSYNKIEAVTVENNNNGVYLLNSNYSEIISSTIKSNNNSGIYLKSSMENTIDSNIIEGNKKDGIYQLFGGKNTYKSNFVSNNTNTGVWLSSGSNDILLDNKVENNLNHGIDLLSSGIVSLKNNSMSGNAKKNLAISNSNLERMDIGTSNISEGKYIYFIKNATNETFDGSMNIGDFYCLNCDTITFKDALLREKDAQIVLWRTNNSFLENVKSSDKKIKIYFSGSSGNSVSGCDLGKIELRDYSSNNKVYNNNFFDEQTPAYDWDSENNIFNLDSSIGGNYWKINEADCVDADNNGICDSAYEFYGGVDNYPLTKEFTGSLPVSTGYSSIIFLPGHQASRLYKEDPWGEMKLWEPENKNIDVEKLYLKPNGESVVFGIYTRDIIGEAYGIKNIYQGFSESMDKFVNDGEIKEWKPIPYDWRLPLEKIAEDGVELEDGGHMDIIDEIKRMAANSKTGKITLIGHSNGGLLAKVLIENLENSGNKNLIDKLIMVGTPQLGTPKAMVALLHGDEANLLHGLVLDKETGRGFAENMVSAYNLLPSKEYFSTVQSPVVEFDEDVKEIYDFRSLYGDNIGNWSEFKSFLLGDDGMRTEPEASDLDAPNVLRETLLARSNTTHDELDFWQAPEGVEVVQIAGWGLDTIRGIEYDDCDILFCPDKLSNLDRSLLFTADGDETVVVPSAVEMGGNAERYYLNLNRYNRLANLKVSRGHADILEIEPLQDFIKNIIKGDKTLTDYISPKKPEVKDEDMRLRFRLHSPVALDLYDESGNHTGFIKNNDSGLQLYEEQMPNSYYTEFGETKYAGAGDFLVNIILTGEDLGTFTFEIDQVAGENVARNTTFANIPVMKDMQARLSISETVSEMKIDVDADGQTDAIFSPGEEIKEADLLEIFEKIINSLSIDTTAKNRLIKKIDNAQKQMEKENFVSANAMLESVKQQIGVLGREQTPQKFRISEEEAEKLVGIIEQIQSME